MGIELREEGVSDAEWLQRIANGKREYDAEAAKWALGRIAELEAQVAALLDRLKEAEHKASRAGQLEQEKEIRMKELLLSQAKGDALDRKLEIQALNLKGYVSQLNAAEEQADAIARERDRLVGALDDYGSHTDTCGGVSSKDETTCGCGYLDALRGYIVNKSALASSSRKMDGSRR